MSKWAGRDAIAIAENLAEVAYQYWLYDEKDEAFENYNLIACGNHPESTERIYDDVLSACDDITGWIDDHGLSLSDKDRAMLCEALDLASAYDGPKARKMERLTTKLAVA